MTKIKLKKYESEKEVIDLDKVEEYDDVLTTHLYINIKKLFRRILTVPVTY